MDFYVTSAQIIAVFMLALTIESGPLKTIGNINQTLVDVIRAFNHKAVYAWGVLGLAVCLIKLGEFSFFGHEAGRVTILFSIATLALYLFTQVLVKNSINETHRINYTGVAMGVFVFISPLVFISLGIASSIQPLDNILVGSMSVILIIIAIITVFKNNKIKEIGVMYEEHKKLKDKLLGQ